MKKFNYLATFWAIFIIYSNVLTSQIPKQKIDIEIVKSSSYQTEKSGSSTFRTKDKILFTQVGLNIESPGGSKLEKARNYVNTIKKSIGLNQTNFDELVYSQNKSDLGFGVFRFIQRFRGLKVDKNQVIISFNDRNNRISSLVNTTIPIYPNFKIIPRITIEQAKKTILKYLKPKGKLLYDNAELMIHVIDFKPYLAYKLNLIAEKPNGDWEAFVNAITGKIIEIKDIASHANGTCKIFCPDPISSSRGTYGVGGLINNNGMNNPTLDALRVEKPLLDITFLDNLYYLSGTFVKIIDDYTPKYGIFSNSSSDYTAFNRYDLEFEALMSYYFIDNNMRYIHNDLGLDDVGPSSGLIECDPHTGESEYFRTINTIKFGIGYIEDAEDADVIIHELGHGIHDFVTGDMNDMSDEQGLHEGFADYWANSNSNSFRNYKEYESQYNQVFKWDGNDPGWTGRRTDQTTSYNDISSLSSPYGQGTIFSTVLMKIYNDIGRIKTDIALLKGMAMAVDGIIQPQAAEFIYQEAEDEGYSDKDLCIIYNHFLTTYGPTNFDPCNENGDPCSNPESSPDIYMMDDYQDFGEEVNSVSSLIYLSEDIWVRNIDDDGFVHQNPEYKTSGSNYVYVRVRGRSCSLVEDGVLHLYWSKASTGLKWPYSWTYNQNDPNTCVIPTSGGNRPCGMEIGTGQIIPELKAGEETILIFAWAPPNPAWYDDIDKHHFCLYARIVSDDDQMFVNEGNFVWLNTSNNNNIAWKNISIFDIDPNNYRDDTISVYVVDVDNVSGAISLGFVNSNKPHYKSVLDNGDVFIVLREPLYSIWEDGGKQGQGFFETEDDRIQITSFPCRFANLTLDSLTYYIVDVIFEGDTVIDPFSFDMLQVNASNIKVGGEQFLYPGNNDTTALPRNKRLKQNNAPDYIVYPNPSDQDIIIKALNPAYIIDEISIINLAGKTILLNNNTNNSQKNEIIINWPINTFPGVYLVKIKSKTGTQIMKIVKN